MIPAELGAALRAARGCLVQALDLEPSVAGLEAQVLLGHVLNQPRAYLLAHPEMTLTKSEQDQFDELVSRRERGEPIAYITALREFYGLSFSVSPDVLIPRPETELLVELALQHIPDDTPSRILDLGTGSGAIAITLAELRPQSWVTATDISPHALDIARENASRLGTSNITFTESNWFSNLAESKQFDLIVANPPYVAENDAHLSQGDLRFEPISALASGFDGLDAIRTIVETAPRFLQSSGRLLFEHGYDQALFCRELLQSLGYRNISNFMDLGGRARVSGGDI